MLSKCQKRQKVDKSGQKWTKVEKVGRELRPPSIAQYSVSITFVYMKVDKKDKKDNFFSYSSSNLVTPS